MATALALVLPVLATGFAFDDYVLLYKLSHPASHDWWGSSPYDLFRWLDPAHFQRLIDGEGLAWWTFARTTIAFLRPVSSVTHAIDHRLWPTSALGMHLHSLIWFALLLGLAAKLYSELSENRWIAGVACAMFALDSAHGIAVGWISNRNALVGGVFAIAALRFHHRRRTGAGPASAALAWLCFGLSLLSAELALGLAGYLVAYALFLERGALRRRLGSLLPYGALCAGWWVIRSTAHYGVYGLGAYIDPVREPLAFARVLPTRPWVLIASQISRLCSDMYELLPAALQPLLLASALFVCGAAVFFAWPVLRSNRSSRFWAAGALLSTLPLAAGLPSDRLLTIVGLGVMPLLAQAAQDALLTAHGAAAGIADRAAIVRRGCAGLLLVVHLVVDPLLLPVLALAPDRVAASTKVVDATLPGDSKLSGQTVIVAKIPDSMMLTYLEMMRTVEGKPRPNKLYWLLATSSQARFERIGPNELRVTAKTGLFDNWEERSSRMPLHPGEQVKLSEMTVTVIKVTKDGRPTVCDFTFARPLGSSSYRWLTWEGSGLHALQLPREGQSETLPPT